LVADSSAYTHNHRRSTQLDAPFLQRPRAPRLLPWTLVDTEFSLTPRDVIRRASGVATVGSRPGVHRRQTSPADPPGLAKGVGPRLCTDVHTKLQVCGAQRRDDCLRYLT